MFNIDINRYIKQIFIFIMLSLKHIIILKNL